MNQSLGACKHSDLNDDEPPETKKLLELLISPPSHPIYLSPPILSGNIVSREEENYLVLTSLAFKPQKKELWT